MYYNNLIVKGKILQKVIKPNNNNNFNSQNKAIKTIIFKNHNSSNSIQIKIKINPRKMIVNKKTFISIYISLIKK